MSKNPRFVHGYKRHAATVRGTYAIRVGDDETVAILIARAGEVRAPRPA
jgi:hypothetical protein